MSDLQPPMPSLPANNVQFVRPAMGMTFGQILERISSLLRLHYKTFIVIGLFPIGALFVVEALFLGVLAVVGAFKHAPAHPDPAMMLWTVLPLSLLFVPVTLGGYGLFYGASSYAAVGADLGQAVTVRQAFSHAWSKAGRYIWLMVLRSLIIAVPMMACAALILGGAALLGLFQKGNQNVTALFFLVPLGMLLYGGALVYAVLASLQLSLAFCACVHENLTSRAAITRSGVLTTGAKGRIFLALLVIYAIGYALFLIFYVVGIFAFVIASIAGFGHLQHASPFVYGAVALIGVFVLVAIFVWIALMMAAYSIAFAVIYRDQCLRIDGPPGTLFAGSGLGFGHS